MKEYYTDVLIIGAGLTGLTTAYYLNKAGKKFMVLEKSPEAGGVIKTCGENGYIFETGPNTGIIGNTAVVELLMDLAGDVRLETANRNAKKRYILKGGQWYHLPMGIVDAIRTPLFTWKDKFRILGEPFRKPGTDPHESLASFVEYRMGTSFLNYAVDPFILGVYAGDPNYIIPKYALPKLYNLVQNYGSLMGGSIKKKFEKKTALEKKVSKQVFSFKYGMSSLIKTLYQKCGQGNFILNALDVVVNKSESGYYTTTFTDKQGERNQVLSKKVITTVGASELAGVLPFLDGNELRKINNLLYADVIEIAIGFNNWKGMNLDGFGGLIPSVEKRDILGILFMSGLFEDRAPENGALFAVFMGGTRRRDLLELNNDEISKIVELECRELLAVPEFNPDLFKIIRHNNAIPQYGIESGVRLETITNIEKKNPGLIIGGNLRDGVGMADRIQQGRKLSNLVDI